MVDDEGRGRLLRLELVASGKPHPYLLRVQQSKHFLLVLERRAGPVAQRETPSAVALFKERENVRAVEVRDLQFITDSLVKILRKGLGRFDAEPMQVEISSVFVPRKQLAGDFRREIGSA